VGQSEVTRAAEALARELAGLRRERGLSQKQLAELIGFDPSYISHVESARHRPSMTFAARADAALGAHGTFVRTYEQTTQARPAAKGYAPGPAPEVDIVVEREQAGLTYVGHTYVCEVRRRLRNVGTRPVVRHPVHIWPDLFPGDPEQSVRWYRQHPVTVPELDFTAELQRDPPEKIEWSLTQDRDSYKKLYLLFRSGDVRYPLYPGQAATLEYRYQISDLHWGQWFQRDIRFFTRELTVILDLPAGAQPNVWGTYAPMSSESGPLPTPIARTVDGNRAIFSWSTKNPALLTSIRLEWRFAGPNDNRGGFDVDRVGRAA